MKFRLMIVTLFMLCSIASGCTTTGEPHALPTLKIIYDIWPGFYPVLIAQEKGYFAEEGINVELAINNLNGNITEEFVAKNYDGLFTSLGLAVGLHETLDIKTVLASDMSDGGDAFVVNSDIQTFEDLRGRTIGGIDLGSYSELLLITLLEAHGISPSELTFNDNTVEEALDGLNAGRFDGALLFGSFIKQAVENGAHVLGSSADVPGLVPDVLIFHTSVIEEHPTAVRSFVRAWFRAVDFWEQNPDEGNQIIVNILEFPVEEVVPEGLDLFNQGENQSYFTPGDTLESIYYVSNLYNQFLITVGGSTSALNTEEFIDPQFLNDN